MSSYYEKMLATGEVKCIDEEIPFEVPKGWEWCRIASLADVVRGGSPRPAGSPIFYDGSIPFLKVADLTRESSIYVKSFSSTIKEAGLSKTRLVGAGTLLLTNSGATLGVPKICTFETTFNDGIAAFLSLDERLKLYVYWFFCYMTDLYRNINQGTAQPNLNTDIIKMTLVPIPPYKEQIRIVEELGNVSPIIKHYEKAQDELDGLNESIPKLIKQSILQEAIRGKIVPQLAEEGTAQELLELIKAEKQKLVKEGKLKKSALNDSVIFRGDDNKYYEKIGKSVQCIDEEIPFEIPESWVWCKFQDIANSELGKTMNKASDKGGEVPYLCSINVYWDKVDLSNVKVAPFSIAEKEKYLLQKGDLLICEGGEAGRCAIWSNDKTMYYQNALHRVRFYGNISSKFIQNVIRIYKTIGIIDKKSKGMTIKHFTKTALNSLYVPLPPVQEQQRIVAQIEKLFEQLR